jgi:hypothetical protein
MKPVPQFQKYIDSSVGRIRNRKTRELVRLEIEEHLVSAYEALIEEGRAEKEAVELALAHMGDAEVLAKELGRVHRPLYLNWVFMLPAVTCVTIIGTGILIDLGTTYLIRQTEISEDRKREVQRRFLEDQKILSQSAILVERREGRDAGELMNTRIEWGEPEWDGKKTYQREIDASGARRKLGFSTETQGLIISPKATDAWTTLKLTPAQLSSNLSWMKDLLKYDYWDIFETGPSQVLRKTAPESINYSMIPIPNLTDIRAAARLRIRQGLARKNILPALVELRKLAQLVYTQEVLVSGMVALAILETEKTGFELALKAGLLHEKEWTPISDDWLKRAKRSLPAYDGAISKFSDLSTAVESGNASVGLCAAAFEHVYKSSYYRDTLLPQWPFERDLTSSLHAGDSVVNSNYVKKHCRLSMSRYLWNDQTWPRRAFSPHPERTWRTWFFLESGRELPVVRQFRGAELLVSLNHNYLDRYDRE